MQGVATLSEMLQIGVPTVLGGAFVLGILIYAVMSAILWYHWTNYAVSTGIIRFASRLYIVLSVICISVAGTALLTYLNSLS